MLLHPSSKLLHSQSWQPKHSNNFEWNSRGWGRIFNKIFTLNCGESIISQSITVHCWYLLLPNLFFVSPLHKLNDVDAQNSSTLTHIIKTSMTPFSWKEFLDARRQWTAGEACFHTHPDNGRWKGVLSAAHNEKHLLGISAKFRQQVGGRNLRRRVRRWHRNASHRIPFSSSKTE